MLRHLPRQTSLLHTVSPASRCREAPVGESDPRIRWDVYTCGFVVPVTSANPSATPESGLDLETCPGFKSQTVP